MSGQQTRAVVIGTSAGGIEALSILLPSLPRDYPLPIIVVLHLPPENESLLPSLFQPKCQMNICEAEDKLPILPGNVYFAPPNYHLLVEKDETLALSSDELVLFSRPSIDILFESAADVYNEDLIGIVLTGANSDGAEGLKAIEVAGGITIVQDPRDAAVPTMPKTALKTCPRALTFDLFGIATFLKMSGENA